MSIVAFAVVIGACAAPAGSFAPSTRDSGSSTSPTEPPIGARTATPTDEGATTTASPASPVPVLDRPWALAELVDVETGERFRIADLVGRPIIIETIAIWCTNCKAQQRHVYEALATLGDDAVSYVLIDVEPNETAAALADYRTANGFTGTYAVADAGLARSLADEFGDQVLNPPSTPMVVIGSDGRVTLTPFGQQKSAEEVVALAREHGA